MTFLILISLALGCGLIYAGSGIHHYVRAKQLHAAKCKAIEELIASNRAIAELTDREALARAHYHLRNPRAQVPRC